MNSRLRVDNTALRPETFLPEPRCFFGAADEFTQPTDAVALYEAGSAYSECEWVASQILKLVLSLIHISEPTRRS